MLTLESVWRRPYTGGGRRIQRCEGQIFSVQNIVQELTRDHITVAIQARNLAPGMGYIIGHCRQMRIYKCKHQNGRKPVDEG